MDAKSRADFINSVAGGQKKTCPDCGALNDSDSVFCFSCGTKLEIAENVNADTDETAQSGSELQLASAVPAEEPEEDSAFAQGLPDWDMVPPQVVVRRKKK